MFRIPIESHEAVTMMTTAYARDVLRVHEGCPMSVCARKRQAIAVINAAAQRTGVRS